MKQLIQSWLRERKIKKSLNSFIGKPASLVITICKKRNIKYRIVEADGETSILRWNHDPERFNLILKDNIVTDIKLG